MDDTLLRKRTSTLSEEEKRLLILQMKRMKEAKERLPKTRSALRRALLRGQIRQGEKARQKLIESLEWICRLMARKFCGVYGVEFDDLCQSANVALCRAIDSYDPAYGVGLPTYVWKPVQRGAARELNSSGIGLRRPIRAVENRAKIKRKIEEAWQNGIRNGEIANALGVRPEEIDAVLIGEVEYLGDAESEIPFSQSDISVWEEIDSLWQAIMHLPIIHRLVIGWLYGLGEEHLSASEIAKRLRRSTRVVRKIESEALQNLKQFLSENA